MSTVNSNKILYILLKFDFPSPKVAPRIRLFEACKSKIPELFIIHISSSVVALALEQDISMTNGCPLEGAYSRLLPYNFAVSEANGSINAREDFHIAELQRLTWNIYFACCLLLCKTMNRWEDGAQVSLTGCSSRQVHISNITDLHFSSRSRLFSLSVSSCGGRGDHCARTAARRGGT